MKTVENEETMKNMKMSDEETEKTSFETIKNR